MFRNALYERALLLNNAVFVYGGIIIIILTDCSEHQRSLAAAKGASTAMVRGRRLL